MTKDISIEAILAGYDLPEFSHAEMLKITEIPDRTVQVWFQRGYLNGLGLSTPGRGRHRRYALGHLFFLSYMRRLAFLSIPVAQASWIASAFLPRRQTPRPDGAVSPQDVSIVLPALEAAQFSDADQTVYGLVYRQIDGEWRNRVARVEEFEKWGGLTGWLAVCVLDNAAIVTDLGRMARVVLADAIRTQRQRLRGV